MRIDSPQAAKQQDMANRSRILVDSKRNMDALAKQRSLLLEMTQRSKWKPLQICFQNSSATTQLIVYHSSWKRLKNAVAWMLKVKKALLKLSRKRKQLLLDDPIDLNHISQGMLKARRSVGQEL